MYMCGICKNICVMVNKMVVLVGIMHNNLLAHVQLLFLSRACMRSKGLRNFVDVCLSVCGPKNIETAEIRSDSLRKGYYNNTSYYLKVLALIVQYTYMISGRCKSSNFLFLIIARLLRPSNIRIYGTKHVTY